VTVCADARDVHVSRRSPRLGKCEESTVPKIAPRKVDGRIIAHLTALPSLVERSVLLDDALSY